MATINLAGKQYEISSETPYIDAYNAYKENQDKIYKQQQDALKSQNEADANKINASYNNTARQAYIQQMQSRNALPEQLKAQGITGGASETALINLQNNYGKNIANNESARGTALADLTQGYNNNLSSLATAYQQQMANAELEALENQAQYTDTLNQRKLQQYSATIGRLNSVSACNKEIALLQASNDPLKAEKIMLVQAQKATLSSGSYGGSYGGSSGTSGTTATTSATGAVKNALTNYLSKNKKTSKKRTALDNWKSQI